MKCLSYSYFVFYLGFICSAYAEIITDGSLGSASHIVGPDFIIDQSLGSRVGNNLFHSFKTFNINTRNGIVESATFTGSAEIKNIISRVTGGEASIINGLLRSEVGQANFYFLNPAGVFFGEYAKVNVPAAFHVSSANSLQFSDGSTFSATDLKNSTLGIAQPEAFGFLKGPSGSIIVEGSRLNFASQSHVSFIAGDIHLSGSDIAPVLLDSSASQIALIAVGEDAMRIAIADDGALLTVDTPPSGSLSMSMTEINTSGVESGRIDIYAGNANLTRSEINNHNTSDNKALGEITFYVAGDLQLNSASQIQSDAYANGDSGNINIHVSGLFELLSGSSLSSATFNTGNAGNISISAQTLSLNGHQADTLTRISSSAKSDSSGNAGDLILTITDRVELLDGALIDSNTLSSGQAGDVWIKADEMLLNSLGSQWLNGVSSQAGLDSIGDAGNVYLSIEHSLAIVNGSEINSGTYGQGDAGDVAISSENLLIDGQGSQWFTGVSSQSSSGSGSAGDVTITILSLLQLFDGGVINNDTFGAGDAGDLVVNTTDLQMDGRGSKLYTRIASQANKGSSGHAGNIHLTASGLVDINNGAFISSSTYGAGDAGNVVLHAENMLLNRQGGKFFTGVFSQANSEATAKAGLVTVDISHSLAILNGAAISSSTRYGDSQGVNVATDSLLIDGRGSDLFTGITSQASSGSIGNAGAVDVIAKTIRLYNGASISSGTFSQGDAGRVLVHADNLLIDGQGSDIITGISSQANLGSSGNAQGISLDIKELIQVSNRGEISSATFGEGDAGDVSIQTKQLVIDGQGSDSFTGITSQAGASSSALVGNVQIDAHTIELIQGGRIGISHLGLLITQSDFDQYISGDISLNADTIKLSDASEIRANAFGNAPAGNIYVLVSDNLELTQSSRITTSANSNDGGAILINGNGSLVLHDALITTSTNGGDGGNINIAVPAMIMDGGFIQANTTIGASGGDIHIEVPYLLTRHALLPEIGDLQRQEFKEGSGRNIIQAAAPEGNPGILSLEVPDMDISASLVNLSSRFSEPIAVSDNPCASLNQHNNRLVAIGRGGLPKAVDDNAHVSFGGARLAQIVKLNNHRLANRTTQQGSFSYAQLANSSHISCQNLGMGF